jgi:hypothetical protein
MNKFRTKRVVIKRAERRISWILLSIGAMIILSFGGHKIVEGIVAPLKS